MNRALGLALCIGTFALSLACPQSGGTVKVEKVEPPQGTTAGGEEVTITGDGFVPGKTQAEVIFGHKKSETVAIASTTKIRAVTPPGEKGPVDISFDDGKAFKIQNGFRYVEPADNSNARNAFFGGNKPGAAKIELEKK
jgi:hypothetical protein